MSGRTEAGADAEPLPVFDVRSPAEYARGHIPGAYPLPLFSNDERAEVGTLYTRTGRTEALERGLEIVGPKLAGIARQARTLAPNGRAGIYCWRGGLRSSSVAWLLETAGFHRVLRLQGGYKAFRRHVQAGFAETRQLRVLGGMTGSGKTEILAELAALGEQVIDLEGLANHRGSSFGHIGQGEQPSSEHFENLLWYNLQRMDPARSTWIEDESQRIGRVQLPQAFYLQKQQSPLIVVELDRQIRAERLAREYGTWGSAPLTQAVEHIRKRLGGADTDTALQAISAGDYVQAAQLILRYYDKSYRYGMDRRSGHMLQSITLSVDDPQAAAEKITEWS